MSLDIEKIAKLVGFVIKFVEIQGIENFNNNLYIFSSRAQHIPFTRTCQLIFVSGDGGYVV